jgi:hypothetical protein
MTLLALVASLESDKQDIGNRVVVLPRSEVLTVDAAATVLASLPKPAECSADAKQDVLFVSCSEITHPDRRFFIDVQKRSIEDGDGPAGAVIRELPVDTGAYPILLLGSRDSLRVSTASLEYWWRNYLITQPLLIGNRDPTESESAAEIEAVIVLARGRTC